MKDIFTKFGKLLDERLSRNVWTTEDSVRYTFFHAVCSAQGVHPHNIILEGQHSTDPRARIDARIELKKEGIVALEFKFHRKMKTNNSRPRPQQAGTVIADMGRLARYSPADKRLLIYLTDSEMATYLKKPAHKMDIFFDGTSRPIQLSPNFFGGSSTTFRNAAGKSIQGVIKCVFKKSLANSHELRIWEVTP